MISSQLSQSVFALPEADRLELARQIVKTIAQEREVDNLVNQGIERIEDVLSGKVEGLSKDEYKQAAG